MINTDYDLEHVKEELADVMVYCRNLQDEALDALEDAIDIITDSLEEEE